MAAFGTSGFVFTLFSCTFFFALTVYYLYEQEPQPFVAILRPITRLFLFTSLEDWEPATYVDFDALSAFSVHKGDRFPSFEIAHPSLPQLSQRFRVSTEEEAEAWVEAIANDSYQKVRLDRDMLAEANKEWSLAYEDLSVRLQLAENYALQREEALKEVTVSRKIKGLMVEEMTEMVAKLRELLETWDEESLPFFSTSNEEEKDGKEEEEEEGLIARSSSLIDALQSLVASSLSTDGGSVGSSAVAEKHRERHEQLVELQSLFTSLKFGLRSMSSKVVRLQKAVSFYRQEEKGMRREAKRTEALWREEKEESAPW